MDNIRQFVSHGLLLTIITPHDYVSPLMQLFPPHEATVSDLADWGHDRVRIKLAYATS